MSKPLIVSRQRKKKTDSWETILTNDCEWAELYWALRKQPYKSNKGNEQYMNSNEGRCYIYKLQEEPSNTWEVESRQSF